MYYLFIIDKKCGFVGRMEGLRGQDLARGP